MQPAAWQAESLFSLCQDSCWLYDEDPPPFLTPFTSCWTTHTVSRLRVENDLRILDAVLGYGDDVTIATTLAAPSQGT